MDWRALGLGVAFVAMWSSAFTSARIVVHDAPPFLALSVRFLISGALALAIGAALGQRLPAGRTQWMAVLVFGLCQNALYLGLNFLAMRTIDASVAVIVASLLPLVVAGLAWATLGERLSPLAMAGLAAGFAGVLVIMTARLGAGADPVALALCVGGVLALAVATLLVRNASGSGGLWIIVGLQMLVGAALLLPVAVLFETWTVNWTPELLLAFAYTVVFPGLVATMIWFVLVGRIGATRAATFHFLNPFFGVAVAALVLDEHVTLRDGVGVAIIMAGILAVQLSRRPPPTPPAPE
ncbi:DMT family transporter [Amaricoccus sp.]|uniref:DMT family transporter n=1 Tax=Amaricoccus sp. TaxID=1872485 RepID=UPI001B47B15D|nr:DMT family transporter [Amaricoccus sp.]MBP7003429.1 DMT family transporter [Amaricoccus sp.]